jgi:hypothetical protein
MPAWSRSSRGGLRLDASASRPALFEAGFSKVSARSSALVSTVTQFSVSFGCPVRSNAGVVALRSSLVASALGGSVCSCLGLFPSLMASGAGGGSSAADNFELLFEGRGVVVAATSKPRPGPFFSTATPAVSTGTSQADIRPERKPTLQPAITSTSAATVLARRKRTSAGCDSKFSCHRYGIPHALSKGDAKSAYIPAFRTWGTVERYGRRQNRCVRDDANRAGPSSLLSSSRPLHGRHRTGSRGHIHTGIYGGLCFSGIYRPRTGAVQHAHSSCCGVGALGWQLPRAHRSRVRVTLLVGGFNGTLGLLVP